MNKKKTAVAVISFLSIFMIPVGICASGAFTSDSVGIFEYDADKDGKPEILISSNDIKKLCSEQADNAADIEDIENKYKILQSSVSENEKKIRQINRTGNALSEDIMTGKTVVIDGQEMTGTMADNGYKKESIKDGESVNYPGGYYAGGEISTPTLESQTIGTMSEDNLPEGTTGWVAGEKIVGNGNDIKQKYAEGYRDGLAHKNQAGTVIYTLAHKHTGSSSSGGGCYTVAQAHNTSCNEPGTCIGVESDSNTFTHKMYYFRCSQGHEWGGWFPGNANSVHAQDSYTTYSLGCGKNETDIIRTTSDYNSITANEKIIKMEIDY